MRPASLLVCTMDRPQLLRRCLEAVRQGEELPEEVIVVDQSRDDRTQEVVASMREALAPARVRTLRSSGGMARGQNEGFALASTEVVLVTDDDCVPDPAWVRVTCDALASDGDLVLVTGRVLPVGPDEPGRLPVATRTSTVPATLHASSMPWDVGSGNNFAARTAALRCIGGNDERLGPGARFRGGADMDLFRRLLRDGGSGRYEPASLVLHERATPAERLGRRVPYGYGMGLACALWWRQGDPLARTIVRQWWAMRARRLVRSVRHRRWRGVQEEVLVLVGTARGLVRGARLDDARPVSSAPAP